MRRDSAESKRMELESHQELALELREFIDQLIVPLLVERLMQQGHLYSAGDSQYDTDVPLADAA